MSKQKSQRQKVMRKLGGHALPDFKRLYDKTALIRALNYASYNFDGTARKKFAVKYAKQKLKLDINCVPAHELYSIGACCWLLLEGSSLEDIEQQTVERLKNLHKQHFVEEKPKVRAKVVKIDYKSIQTNNALGELEGVIDDVLTKQKNIKQPLDVLKESGTSVDLQAITNHFKKQLDDIELHGDDYDKDTKKILSKVLKIIIDDVTKYRTTQKIIKKKVRKPRRPRAVDPSKLVRKLKYLKEDTTLGIKSIQPKTIIGSQVLWVFNTKTRTIIQYNAVDNTGLSCSGTSIKNFDPDTSKQKTVRKPEEFLNLLPEATKVQQRKLLDTLNTKEKSAKSQLNNYCLLLKVYK